MELLMKFIFRFLISAFSLPFVFAFTAACSGEKSQEKLPPVFTGTALSGPQPEIDAQTLLRSLDELAELERAGTWLAGMALTESGIRENAGDLAGSVAAAYKEMAFAYGRGLIQKQDIEQGLSNLLAMKNDEKVVNTANAILAFEREQWATASVNLLNLFDQYDEPDGFASWMILVCALEKDSEDRRSAAAYKAIRARYAQFPEYWYRGAKAFSGILAAEYAENCINTSVQGPFADECRKIIAAYTGIKAEEGSSIRTKKEIESIITESVNAGNPQLLDPLLPLIGLPENPYTVYAVGALRALTSVPRFKEYFNVQAGVSSGRLAERLSYICRG
jgi:hypothetical protein